MDLEVNRGETLSRKIVVSKGDDKEDLSDYQLFFTVKKSIRDLDLDDVKADIRKEVTKLPEIGEARLDLTEGDTFLKGGDYFYDIKLRKDNGLWVRVFGGSFRVNDVATNRQEQ